MIVYHKVDISPGSLANSSAELHETLHCLLEFAFRLPLVCIFTKATVQLVVASYPGHGLGTRLSWWLIVNIVS